MQVKCGCGKQLKIPDTLAGKNAKCPGCGKVFKVPAAPSAAADAPAKIVVECSCGKKLAAPASAAGKRVRCPACNAAVAVPAAKPAAEAPTAPGKDGSDFQLDMFEPPPPPSAGTLQSSSPRGTSQDGGEEYDISASRCPNCDATLDPGVQFCISCGTHLGSGAKMEGVNVEELTQEKARGKKASLIVGGAVAAVVLISAVTWFLVKPKFDFSFFGSKSDSGDTSTAPSEKPPAEKKPPKLGPPPLEKRPDEGYLEIVVYQPGRARAKLNQIGGEQAIKAFEIEHERFPESIEELERAGYRLAELQTGLEYEYDKETGKISIIRTKDKEAAAGKEPTPPE